MATLPSRVPMCCSSFRCGAISSATGCHSTLSFTFPFGVMPKRHRPCATAARVRPSANLTLMREYGNQISSVSWVGIRGTVIACWRQYEHAARPAPARADTGLLPAAHRQGEAEDVREDVVDVHRTHLELTGYPQTACVVAGPHGGRQPVRRVVGQADGLGFVSDPDNRQGWPECFPADARHRLVDVGEHGRLEETYPRLSPCRRSPPDRR